MWLVFISLTPWVWLTFLNSFITFFWSGVIFLDPYLNMSSLWSNIEFNPESMLTWTSLIIFSIGLKRIFCMDGVQKSHPRPHPRIVSTSPCIVAPLIDGIWCVDGWFECIILGTSSFFSIDFIVSGSFVSASPRYTWFIPSLSIMSTSATCQADFPPTIKVLF